MDSTVELSGDRLEFVGVEQVAAVVLWAEFPESWMVCYFKYGNPSTSQRNMKLELRNGIARKILTGEEMRGEGDVPIEVALVDDETGEVVDDEPGASAQVEFFLLNASGGDDDWSIVPQVEGKQPILAENVSLNLHRGLAVVKNIKIRNHTSMIKPPEFKLGARLVGGASLRITLTIK